jgi:peptidoglycan hydrolase-like protein with peptidoglycan-binding domain
MLERSDDPYQRIGLRTFCQRLDGRDVSQDYSAVFHGVVGIQMLLNNTLSKNMNCDGVFGPVTDAAVREFQKSAKLFEDGVVGIRTVRSLMYPLIVDAANKRNESWQPIFGIMQSESGWDPGAIGFTDPNDVGLAQINLIAHPHVSFAQALCPSFATNFVAEYFRNALNQLNNNEDDAIASYNLGIGGTRMWIAAGRPDVWTPPWSGSGPRKVSEYIAKIRSAAP